MYRSRHGQDGLAVNERIWLTNGAFNQPTNESWNLLLKWEFVKKSKNGKHYKLIFTNVKCRLQTESFLLYC